MTTIFNKPDFQTRRWPVEDFSVFKSWWLELPRTAEEARLKLITRFYHPNYICKYGHNSPRQASNLFCLKCAQDYNRGHRKPTIKKVDNEISLLVGCMAEPTNKQLKRDDESRNLNCPNYTRALAWSWHGHNKKSWFCPNDCPKRGVME